MWTGFTRFTVFRIEWKTTGWMYIVQWEIDKKTEDLKTKQVWPEMWKDMSDASKSKSGLTRNQSSTIPEDCVVFTSLTLMMRNSKTPWRMRVEIWKFRCQPQCFANFNVRSTGKPDALTSARQNTFVLLKPMNLWGNAWKDFFTRIMKIILQVGGMKFIDSLQSCSQIHSYASSNTRCKGSSGEIFGKLEKIPACQLTKVRNKEEVIAEARKESKTVHFASLMDVCSQEFGVGATVCKIRRSSCIPRWHCERWFMIICSIHGGRDHRHHKRQPQRSSA